MGFLDNDKNRMWPDLPFTTSSNRNRLVKVKTKWLFSLIIRQRNLRFGCKIFTNLHLATFEIQERTKIILSFSWCFLLFVFLITLSGKIPQKNPCKWCDYYHQTTVNSGRSVLECPISFENDPSSQLQCHKKTPTTEIPCDGFPVAVPRSYVPPCNAPAAPKGAKPIVWEPPTWSIPTRFHIFSLQTLNKENEWLLESRISIKRGLKLFVC